MPNLHPWCSALGQVLALMCLCSPVEAAELVSYKGDAKPGTVVVETGSRLLYLVLAHHAALRYVVGVGRPDGNGTAGQ